MHDYFFKKNNEWLLLNMTLDAPIFKNLKPFSEWLIILFPVDRDIA